MLVLKFECDFSIFKLKYTDCGSFFSPSPWVDPTYFLGPLHNYIWASPPTSIPGPLNIFLLLLLHLLLLHLLLLHLLHLLLLHLLLLHLLLLHLLLQLLLLQLLLRLADAAIAAAFAIAININSSSNSNN